jgi:hypothetical protein
MTVPESMEKINKRIYISKKKTISQYPWWTDTEIINKILPNRIQWHIENIIYHDQVGFIPALQGGYDICKSINRFKDKSHIIISIDAEKEFNKIQHHLMIKPLKKLGIEGMLLNIRKTIYNKTLSTIILNGEEVKPLALKSEGGKGVHSSHSCST